MAEKASFLDDKIRIQNNLNKLKKRSKKTQTDNREFKWEQIRKTSSTKSNTTIRSRHKDNGETDKSPESYQVNNNHQLVELY